MPKTLVIVVGPTGVGKTDLSIRLAESLNTEIISADSRQVYKELSIGTAVPTQKQLKTVHHHLISCKSIHDYYSAGRYEHEVLGILEDLFQQKKTVVLTGGSGMYIDAISKGIQGPPDIDEEIRKQVQTKFETEGIESLRFDLKRLDPEYYAKADLQNGKRLMKALEVCLHTGNTHSSYLKNTIKKRPFNILKIGLERDREILYDRINQRADIMLEEGLLEEVKGLREHASLNALNTVGYKEFFAYYNGEHDLEEAVRLFKRNSRRYAKRQMTWFKRDSDINWFDAGNVSEVINFVESKLET